MIFFVANTHLDEEEEEEEDSEGGIDDELLGELDDEAVEDDELVEGVIDPLIPPAGADLESDVVEGDLKEEGALFEDDDDEDMDYDSFDDRDEL